MIFSIEIQINWFKIIHLGAIGFDAGCEPLSACRGAVHLVNTPANLLVANDDNYALAA